MWKIASVATTGLVFASTAVASDPIRLPEVRAARRLHPLELAAKMEVAAAGRVLVGAQWNPLGASVSLAGGVRRDDLGERAADVAVEIDVPILLASRERRDLEAALGRAENVLGAGATVLADLEVEQAYVEAWRDQQRVAVQLEAVRLLERWLAIAERRVEAGAEAPFRVVVARGELERAQLELIQARARAIESRGRLESLVPLVGGSAVLADPGPAKLDGESEELGLVAVAAATSVELLNAMDLVGLRSDAARWGLNAELAAEGQEDVARLGVTYRIPRPGESTMRETMIKGGIAHRQRELEARLAAYATRLAVARSVLDMPAEQLEAAQLEAGLRALEALVEEGKAGLGEVLVERRSLIEARSTSVDRRAAEALAVAEIRALTRRTSR